MFARISFVPIGISIHCQNLKNRAICRIAWNIIWKFQTISWVWENTWTLFWAWNPLHRFLIICCCNGSSSWSSWWSRCVSTNDGQVKSIRPKLVLILNFGVNVKLINSIDILFWIIDVEFQTIFKISRVVGCWNTRDVNLCCWRHRKSILNSFTW